MTVYVDDMKAPLGEMLMSHMIADTSEELHAMADRIGVSRRWCQFLGEPKEHYDICQAKRALAVRYGAQEISQRELARMTRERRDRKDVDAEVLPR